MMKMTEQKIVVFTEDKARETFAKDPLNDIDWYYRMQKIEEGGQSFAAAVETSCYACNHEAVCNVYCNSGYPGGYRYAWFCNVCACSFGGNAFWHPDQYDEKLMQHISLCTNMILDEIKALKK